MKFKLKSSFKPTGDQPAAIEKLVANLDVGIRDQTLLGVTGSGKTFTVANVIARTQRPTLVISHNKTLAAQLYQEFKEFFPGNAVHYFVSYYDYYQPEAYLPRTDTYIEKDAKINEAIDALRHASTASLLTRRDVVIVASVSCIYGIGNPEEYERSSIELSPRMRTTRMELVRRLVMLQYARNPLDPKQGHFRIRENTVEVWLPSAQDIIEIELGKSEIVSLRIRKNDIRVTEKKELTSYRLFPAKHFVTPKETLGSAVTNIRQELKDRLAELKDQGRVLEVARLKQRTEFDLEMLQSTGYVNGIENYSRQLDFRAPGSPPHTLIDYFRKAHPDFLTAIDESHVSIPQIRGMYRGDRARKDILVQYGFRLPSAVDNRPLTFDEFNQKIGQVVYVSATPAAYELERSEPSIAEQLIRPTGILDPEVEIRPANNQIQDVIVEIRKRASMGERSLVMALTKRLAEDIAEYLKEAGIKTEYLHSEIKTLERPEILKKLRLGEYDAIVGINLLREGLDLPEVSFIAILDADKEGFLRNETTLLQIMGRAARHISGKVILYADVKTGSIKAAINETTRRRKIQEEYNRAHDLTPQKIEKEIRKSLREEIEQKEELAIPEGSTGTILKALEHEMKKAAREMDFERAAKLRDRIKKLSEKK